MKMESTVDLEQVLREQAELHEKQLSSLQQRVNDLESKFTLYRSRALWLIAFLGLGSFGGWIWLTNHIADSAKAEVGTAVKAQIAHAVKDQIDPKVATIIKDVDGKLEDLRFRIEQEMDDLVRTNRVFLEVIDDVTAEKLPPIALHRLPKERIQTDGLFNLYVDALVKWGEYEAAYQLLSELKNRGKFPKNFKWPDSYSQAGLIHWVKALSLSRPEREGETQQAVDLLIEAAKLGGENPPCGLGQMEIRRPLELLVFLSLSQGKKTNAKYFAQRAKNVGTTRSDLSGYLNRTWFAKLKENQPNIQQDLEEILSTTFRGE
jgi:pentatricopeptide repeat protein